MKKNKLWATMDMALLCTRSKLKSAFTILLIVSLHMLAGAQGKKNNLLSVNVKDASVKEVFRLIEKQTSYTFVYDGDLLKSAKPISLTIVNQPIDKALQTLCAREPFLYTLKGRFIILRAMNTKKQTYPTTYIDGVVLDAIKHAPIVGATILINGQMRCVTDAAGRFTTQSRKGDSSLSVSSIGYEIFRTDLTKSEQVKVFLHPKTERLNTIQVVSTGYMKIPKERATGSFEYIGQDLFGHQSGMGILSRLDGIANGLTVDKSTTTGGIMIRGLSTINGPKAPLIVVNNFPYDGDISNINPNDVESITILKDAAAASIWGARAGNGVLVITTKKGSFNETSKVTFNSSIQTASKPDLGYIPQINTSDYIDVEKFLFTNGFYDGDISSVEHPVISRVVELLNEEKIGQISASQAEDEINTLRGLDVRKQFEKYMYQRSFNQQYSLSFQGGTNKLNWISSIGMDRQAGNLHETNGRNNFHFDVNYKPFKNLQIGSNIYYTEYNTSSGRPGYGGIVSNDYQLSPYAQFADNKGNPLVLYREYAQSYKDTVGGGKLLDWNYYPMEDYKHNYTKNEVLDNILNFNIKYSLPMGLTGTLLYQHERQHTEHKQVYDDGSYYARDLINYYTQIEGDGTVNYPIPKGGLLDRNTLSLRSNDLRFQVNYDKRWGNSILNLLAGSELRNERTDNYKNRYYGYDPAMPSVGYVDYTGSYPNFIDGGNVQVPMMDDIGYTQSNFVSYFINGAFTLHDKYILSFSGRRDASNLFGLNTNDQWNPFWSGGAAWKLSDERFYHIAFLPFLELKATYGFSGNINPAMSAVTTIAYLSNNQYYNTPTARFDNIYNPDLKWESSRMINLAVDFKTRNNMLNGSIEYYRKKGTNLFGNAPIDYTTGIGTTITKNAADMQGSGWDIKLTALPVNGLIQWRITGNVSNYKDKVTKNYLSDLNGYNFVNKDGNGIFGVPGYAVIGVYGYKWAGLDPKTGDPIGYLNGEKSEDYTSITYNGTSVDDLHYFGSAIPTWFGSLINNLQYKRWELEWCVQFKLGYYFHRNSINYYSLFNQWIGDADFAKRWQKPGDEKFTNVPSMVYPEPIARSSFYTGSEVLVDRGDHFRLKYINLSYTLPLKKNRHLELYLNAADLGILWKANHDGIDPDYNIGLYSIKPTPTYTFGIRFNY